jgi:hypothetical protein
VATEKRNTRRRALALSPTETVSSAVAESTKAKPERLANPPLTSRGRISIRAYPELMKEWDPVANAGIDPAEVSHGSNVKRAWICSDCGHHWPAAPSSRVRGDGCRRGFLHGGNTLAEKHEKIAAEWDSGAAINQGETPETIAPNHNKRRAWICSDCGHHWDAQPCSRVKGGGCSDCAGWSIGKIRRTLARLDPLILAADETERERLLRETKLLYTNSRGRIIVEAIRVGSLSDADYAAFHTDTGDSAWLIDRLLGDDELLKHLPKRPYIPNIVRRAVHAYDNHCCQLCRTTKGKMVLDHFVPWVLGGPSLEENLWTLCATCNGTGVKGRRFPNEDDVDKWLASGRDLPPIYLVIVAAETDGDAELADTRLAA